MHDLIDSRFEAGSERALNMKSAAVRELLARSKEVAVLPPSGARILRIAQDPRSDVRAIAAVVKTDPGIAGRVLSAANSVVYAGRSQTQATSIEKAIARLGLEMLKGMVMQLSFSQRVLRVPGLDPVVRKLTRRAVFAAVATRAIARAVGLDGELGFTIGLIHDVGWIVGLDAYGTAQPAVKKRIAVDMHGALAVIDLVHEEVGENVGKTWGLAPMIIDSIAHHHRIAERHRALQYPAIAALGDRFAEHVDFDREANPDHRPDDVREDPELCNVGLTVSEVDAILAQLPEEAGALLGAFS